MRLLLNLICGLAIVAMFAGCSAKQLARTETIVADTLISDQQEDQLGLEVKKELEAQGMKYVQDPAITSYVQGIAAKIYANANKDRPNVKWRTAVIDDPKTVNAFATPGGFIYVYTGLLLKADNEAEVAGVMGHEAAHVTRRHSARQLVKVYGMQAVIGAATGKNPGTAREIAGALLGVGGQVGLLANSRSNETEADESGVGYTSRAGYDPKGLMTFFQKLQASSGSTPGILKWLSTHPPHADRVSHVNAVIASQRLGGTDVGADRLAAIKAKIAP